MESVGTLQGSSGSWNTHGGASPRKAPPSRMAGLGLSGPAYGRLCELEETLSPEAFDEMVGWVLDRVALADDLEGALSQL